MSVQLRALYKAAGTMWAGENGQREVCEGVPQQGAEGELGEVTNSAAQALRTHVVQQMVFDSLTERREDNRESNGSW